MSATAAPRLGGSRSSSRFTLANGDKYIGQFKDNKMHGEGTFTFADGTIPHQGEWANGRPVGPALR